MKFLNIKCRSPIIIVIAGDFTVRTCVHPGDHRLPQDGHRRLRVVGSSQPRSVQVGDAASRQTARVGGSPAGVADRRPAPVRRALGHARLPGTARLSTVVLLNQQLRSEVDRRQQAARVALLRDGLRQLEFRMTSSTSTRISSDVIYVDSYFV